MKRGTVAPQPDARCDGVIADELIDERMEFRPMVHMDPVRHFVRHRRAANAIGHQDQSPAIANSPARRATAPAAFGITDRDTRNGNMQPIGKFGRFCAEHRERLALEPGCDPTRQSFDWPAAVQPISFSDDPPRACGIPDDRHCTISDRNHRTGSEGTRKRQFGALFGNPFAMPLGPTQRGGERRTFR